MSSQVKSSRTVSIAGAASQPLSTIQLMPSDPEAPQPPRRNDEALPHAGLTAAPMRPGLLPWRRTKPPSARTHDAHDDAITTAYREHHESMLAKALSITHNREAAQDIVQLSFEKACKHPEGFTSSRGSVRNWLLTITQNTAIDHLRRSKTHPETALDFDSPSEGQGRGEGTYLNSARHSTRDHADEVTDRRTLMSALTQLPVHHSQILILIHLDGLTPTEAADYLGIPAGTARSRHYHALRGLRRLMQEPTP